MKTFITFKYIVVLGWQRKLNYLQVADLYQVLQYLIHEKQTPTSENSRHTMTMRELLN